MKNQTAREKAQQNVRIDRKVAEAEERLVEQVIEQIAQRLETPGKAPRLEAAIRAASRR